MPIEEERTRNKEGHILKDYEGIQSIKKHKIQEESDDKDNKEKEQSFGDDLE